MLESIPGKTASDRHTMNIARFAASIILAAYVAWEVVRFPAQYRDLKVALANGDVMARLRVYKRAIAFEWVSTLLALLALGFDWSRLTPKLLPIDRGWLRSVWSGHADRSVLGGMAAGVALAIIGLAIAGRRGKRRRSAARRKSPPEWLKKLLPDFSALIPVSAHERYLWSVVAVSAGVCEQVVFRGWLLPTLSDLPSMTGVALICAASVIFGLAHVYQGVAGVIVTSFIGAVFCVLYLITGSLLVPIVLHILVDVRFAVQPASMNPLLAKQADQIG